MRLDPDEVAKHFGIADLSTFDVKKHDLATSPSRRPLVEALGAASEAEATAFWAKFANRYVDNLLSAMLIFLDTNPSNINMGGISSGSQFSRYIRVHPNGSLVLPKLIERFSVMCPIASDLNFDENDPSSTFHSEVLAHQIFGQCSFIWRTLQLSPSSTTLSSLPSPIQVSASTLLHRITEIISIIPTILAQHEKYFAWNPKPTEALKSGLDDALMHAKGIVPFLKGEVSAGEMRDWKNHKAGSWWDCEVAVGHEGYSSSRCEREGLLHCAGCNAVSYCCREHQKQNWKLHKLECLPPAW